MSAGIECVELRKSFGDHVAVGGISFTAPAGSVTGFVGVNGAGKTTTMRMLLGLVRPSAGEALIAGRHYRDLPNPRLEVGAVLDALGAHPGHTARAHLRILAAASGVGDGRVAEVLELVELSGDARRRVGKFSLGMRQRLALAGALLGEPPVLLLDEPTKGLDPPGIRWLRELVRARAEEGACVLMSSHHLAELETIADRVVMIDRGRIVADAPTAELVAGGALEDVFFGLTGSRQ